MCFFSRSNTILIISQKWLVRLIWNEKEVHWLDTGYLMWPWPLTSLMTLTLDVSWSTFEIALSQELSDWCEMKRKWVKMILGRLYDHNHDLDLGDSRSESEIALSQELGGRMTLNDKDLSHPFMTMMLTSVTMVGWADVPDSDRDGWLQTSACRRHI